MSFNLEILCLIGIKIIYFINYIFETLVMRLSILLKHTMLSFLITVYKWDAI